LLLRQDSFSGSIATNGKSSLNLNVGRPIRAIYLLFLTSAGVAIARSAIETQCAKIGVYARNEPLVYARPEYCHALLGNYPGSAGADGAADDGVVRIPMYRRGIIPVYGGAVIDGESLRFGTRGPQGTNIPVRVEIEWATIATIAEVRCYVEYANTDDHEPGIFPRLVEVPQSGFGTSEESLSGLPLGDGRSLRAVHVDIPAAGVLSKVRVKEVGVTKWEVDQLLMSRVIKGSNKTPQTGFYHVDFLLAGMLNETLSLAPAANPQVQMTWSTAPTSGQFISIFETIEQWGKTAGV